MMAEVGEMVNTKTFTVALAFNAGFAVAAAVTVWLPACAGAVYRPDAEMVPTVEFPPTTPSTVHVMPAFVDPGIVAVNCWVVDAIIVTVVGEIPIVEIVTDALAVADVSATLVAMTVWLPACAGALYKPLALMVPTVALPPVTLSTDQVTAALEKPWIVALNCCVPEGATIAVDGVIPIIPTTTEAPALIEGSAWMVATTL